jgi:hypothetical protein
VRFLVPQDAQLIREEGERVYADLIQRVVNQVLGLVQADMRCMSVTVRVRTDEHMIEYLEADLDLLGRVG